MDVLFAMLEEFPILGWFISFVIMCIIISWVYKKISKLKKEISRENKINSTDTEEIGDKDEVVKPNSWYRTQNVTQPVIKRTAEQQRIVDEYFIIRNYKTTTCISAYKKKYKTIKPIANIILLIGLILVVINFVNEDFELDSALENGWFIIGLIALAVGFICKFIANSFKKKFEASIKHKIAPQKVLTDDEYEQLVDEKIAAMNIEQIGLDRLGLDLDQVKEIRPIVLRDKVIEKELSFTVYNRNDDSVHSSTQHVTYLYFTDEQLFVYKIQFDMCCNVQDEWAHEFFYKDICDIRSYTYRNIYKFDNSEYEYSSVAFSVISSNSEISFEIDGDNENISSIQAMKQKIREKKAQ